MASGSGGEREGRTGAETDADRSRLRALLEAKPDLTVLEAARALNAARAAAASSLGESQDAAAAAAPLPLALVEADLSIAAAAAGHEDVATLVARQAAEVMRDIEVTYRTEREVREDLAVSRASKDWERIKGRRGKDGQLTPSEMVRHTQQSAASAALWTVLDRCLKRRTELRRELRALLLSLRMVSG